MDNDKSKYILGLDGTQRWYFDQMYHNDNGPSIVYPDGTEHWHKNGNRHRLDGPAIVNPNGRNYWYINDFYVTDLITSWAKENDIDLKNLSDMDKALIKLIWSDYDGK